MLDSRERTMLLDEDFQPSDRLGRLETWLGSVSERILLAALRVIDAFARRPERTFGLWALWLSILYFGLGSASYVKFPDCGNGTLPARMRMANDCLKGELGNWMSYSGCGVDRVLNNYRLEPHCLLLGIVPGWLGYGAIMFMQRFIAGYFLFRVLRDDLKLAPRAALCAGTVYALFHQIGIHWQWDGFTLYDGLGIPGLPALFWCANRLHDRGGLFGMVGSIGMGILLALSSPYFQALFFPFLALFWYTLIQREWTARRWLLLTLTFVGWAAITAPEMYAAAKFVPLSHRVEIVVNSQSPYVKFIENVQYWAPTVWRTNRNYLYAALICFVYSRFRDFRVAWSLGAIVGILAFVRNYHFFNDEFLSHLGILSSFHFHRFVYLVPFLCAVCLGLSLHAIPPESVLSLSNRVTALRIHVAPLAIIVVIGMIFGVSASVNNERWKQTFRGESFHLLYHHPDLQALAKRLETEEPFRAACVSDLWRSGLGMSEAHLWSISPGVLWAYGLETTDGYEVLYPIRYKQFWSETIGPLMQRDEFRRRQHAYWGNMVYLWAPSDQKLEGPLGGFYDLELLSLTNTRYIVSGVPLSDPRLTLLPSDGREAFLERKKRRTTERIAAAFRGEWSYKPLWIYENSEALPRCFLTPYVKMCRSSEELLASLRTRPTESFLASTLVLESDVPKSISLEAISADADSPAKKDCGRIEIITREHDRWEIEIESKRPCMFFLSQTHSPYWRAELDGQATEIVPANHAFQGVFIPSAGKHRLTLSYHPLYSVGS